MPTLDLNPVAPPLGANAHNPAAARLRGAGALNTFLRNNPIIAGQYFAIEAIADAAAGVYEGNWAASVAAREAYDDAQADLAVAQSQAEQPNGQPLTADERRDFEAAIKQRRAALDDAQARLTASTTASAGARGALNAATLLLNQTAVGGGTLKLVSTAVPKGNLLDVIAKQRSIISELNSEEMRVDTAIAPKAHVERMVDDQFERLRERGELKIHVGARGVDIRTPLTAVAAEAKGDTVPVAQDALALLAALMPDVVRGALQQAVDVRYEGVTLALDGPGKAKRLEEIAAEKLDAERVEVAAVLAAYRQGQPVWLREDTDARALLGVEA